MQRNSGTRFFPIVIIIIIAALVIAAVVSIGRAVFNGGGGDNKETSQVDQGRESLLDTSVGHSAQMTVRGPIVAEENFSSYRVTVSNTERTMNVYSGYLESQTDGKTLENNTQAYEQFVYALDKANMMKGQMPDDDTKNDIRGICARGYVYEFAVLSGGNEVKKLWTSTCDGSKGTLDASKDQLSQLFLSQVPDANKMIPFKQSSVLSL